MSKLIPVSKGKFFAIVDNHLFDMLSSFTWHGNRSRRNMTYPTTTIGTREVRMSRLLMGLSELGPSLEVDHINGNTLDNRLENLRIVTHRQNCFNKVKRSDSKQPYKGVHKHSANTWRARIGNGGRLRMACFKTAEEAAKQYDIWAKELHGPYARLNFPEAKETF